MGRNREAREPEPDKQDALHMTSDLTALVDTKKVTR